VLDEVLTTLRLKNFVTKHKQVPSIWTDTLLRPKIDLKDVGCEGMAWLDLAHDRDSWREVLNAVMKIRFP